jgi:hypothetical protein
MFIPVVVKDGHEELVSKDELRFLMSNKQVMSFKRSDGWVVLGRDKMRKQWSGTAITQCILVSRSLVVRSITMIMLFL